jgi:hypothetical protein
MGQIDFYVRKSVRHKKATITYSPATSGGIGGHVDMKTVSRTDVRGTTRRTVDQGPRSGVGPKDANSELANIVVIERGSGLTHHTGYRSSRPSHLFQKIETDGTNSKFSTAVSSAPRNGRKRVSPRVTRSLKPTSVRKLFMKRIATAKPVFRSTAGEV